MPSEPAPRQGRRATVTLLPNFGGTPGQRLDPRLERELVEAWPESPKEKLRVMAARFERRGWRLRNPRALSSLGHLSRDVDEVVDCVRRCLTLVRRSNMHMVVAMQRVFKAIRVLSRFTRTFLERRRATVAAFVEWWAAREEDLREEFQRRSQTTSFRIHVPLHEQVEEFKRICTPQSDKETTVRVLLHRRRVQFWRQRKLWRQRYKAASTLYWSVRRERRASRVLDAAGGPTEAGRRRAAEMVRARTDLATILGDQPTIDTSIGSVSIEQLMALWQTMDRKQMRLDGERQLADWERGFDDEKAKRRELFMAIAVRREREWQRDLEAHRRRKTQTDDALLSKTAGPQAGPRDDILAGSVRGRRMTPTGLPLAETDRREELRYRAPLPAASDALAKSVGSSAQMRRTATIAALRNAARRVGAERLAERATAEDPGSLQSSVTGTSAAASVHPSFHVPGVRSTASESRSRGASSGRASPDFASGDPPLGRSETPASLGSSVSREAASAPPPCASPAPLLPSLPASAAVSTAVSVVGDGDLPDDPRDDKENDKGEPSPERPAEGGAAPVAEGQGAVVDAEVATVVSNTSTAAVTPQHGSRRASLFPAVPSDPGSSHQHSSAERPLLPPAMFAALGGGDGGDGRRRRSVAFDVESLGTVGTAATSPRLGLQPLRDEPGPSPSHRAALSDPSSRCSSPGPNSLRRAVSPPPPLSSAVSADASDHSLSLTSPTRAASAVSPTRLDAAWESDSSPVARSGLRRRTDRIAAVVAKTAAAAATGKEWRDAQREAEARRERDREDVAARDRAAAAARHSTTEVPELPTFFARPRPAVVPSRRADPKFRVSHPRRDSFPEAGPARPALAFASQPQPCRQPPSVQRREAILAGRPFDADAAMANPARRQSSTVGGWDAPLTAPAAQAPHPTDSSSLHSPSVRRRTLSPATKHHRHHHQQQRPRSVGGPGPHETSAAIAARSAIRAAPTALTPLPHGTSAAGSPAHGPYPALQGPPAAGPLSPIVRPASVSPTAFGPTPSRAERAGAVHRLQASTLPPGMPHELAKRGAEPFANAEQHRASPSPSIRRRRSHLV